MSARGGGALFLRHGAQRRELGRGARRHRRGARRRRSRARRRGATPSPRCARRATTRSRPAAMGFCLVEQRRRRRAARAAARPRSACSSSTGTCTTATAPRRWCEHDATIRYVSLHQHPWYPGTGMADERGVGNVFNVPRGTGRAAGALRRRSLGRDRRRDHRAGRPTWCSSPPASTPCWAIRSAASRSSPSTTPISPGGCGSGCRPRRSSGCSRAATSPPDSPTGCWRTSSPSPSLHPRVTLRSAPPRTPWPTTLHMEAEYLELRTRHPFIIARGGQSDYRTVWVRLHDADGHEGWGEAAPSKFYGETAETVLAALNVYVARDARRIRSISRRPSAAGSSLLRGNAVGAGGALLRAARSRRQAARRAALPALGTRSVEGAAVHLHHRPRHPRADPAKVREAARVSHPQGQAGHRPRRRDPAHHPRRHRQGDPGRRQLRLDREAGDRACCRCSQEFGVTVLEQPLPPTELDGLAAITRARPPFRSSPTRAAGRRPTSRRWSGKVDGINIKLAKCGSLREAIRMIAVARAHGLHGDGRAA